MGANRLPQHKTARPSHTPRSLHRPVMGTPLVAVAPSTTTDAEAEEKPVATPSLKEETQLLRRWSTNEESEQYVLVAKAAGWYPCLHSRRINFYLKTHEVWKYGVAGSGKFGRFKAMFLLRNKVSYIIQFRGAFPESLLQQQIRLFNYRRLPENLARPPAEQLPRPPYNPVTPLANVF